MKRAEQHLLAAAARDRIERPRLEALLAALPPVTVLVGPPGSGKTDLLRGLVRASDALYYRVGNGRCRFARFVAGFAEAVAPVAPGAQASFPRAWERSLQSRSPAGALADWLCGHLAGIERAVAIDDFHDAAADPSIASFIAALCELRPHAPLIIAGREVGALPIALWMATGKMQSPIGEAELKFDQDERLQAFERFDVPHHKALFELLAATNGLPVAVAYALTRLRDDRRAFALAAPPSTFEGIAAHIYDRRTEREKEFLLTAALLPAIDDDALGEFGWADAREIRAAMGSDTAFMWDSDDQGTLTFHDRFADYLDREFQARDMAFRSSAAHQAVHSLVRTDQHAAALAAATRQPIVKAMGEMLDAHGFGILESGKIDVISDALEVVEESSLGATGLALRGYIEARSGRLDTAEAWFRLGLEKAQDQASRVTIALYYARELGLRRREDACDVLKAFAASSELPRNVLVDVRSSFARALTDANRLEEARFYTDQALALLEADSPPALRARVYARAATVALQINMPDVARERALIAAPIAVAHSLFDVAGSAYSSLYNVAYDTDDDVDAAMEYLGCIHEMGVKSGALRTDLFALIGMYELHAEAGDEAALARLDDQLDLIDKHDATVQIIEALIPAKALRAGWVGDFNAAQRLLRPTAEHLGVADREAACWAQIALYCAADGDPQAAAQAADSAQKSLAQVEHAEHARCTTQFGLALLMLALAAFVGDDIAQARRWLQRANDAGIGRARRLCALRAAVEAMIAGCGDAERFGHGVGQTLAGLRAVSFGGFAKLIEALPYPCTTASPAGATIGSVLGESELAARFAAAAATRDATTLRTWLDTAHHSLFKGESITARFERWATENGNGERAQRAGRDTVSRALTAYRRPAPAIVRHIDDVDASINALFADLAVASPLMAEHSHAVSAWCSRLGRTLGLSESEVAFVTRCGLIHDVGKIWTPAEILDAPRRLTTEEWVIMRAHTTDGSAFVARVPNLGPFIPIVRGHHERLDGKGYPDALRASEIPRAARIVAVADCFNAMIGRRPYRPPMVPTEALNELERHAGTQFDPEIVAAMIQVVLGKVAA